MLSETPQENSIMTEETVQAAIEACKTAHPCTTIRDGTAISEGHPFLDYDANCWIPEDQLLAVMEEQSGARPEPAELQVLMTAVGSRRQEFRTSRWVGHQYEQTVVAAWSADRPLDDRQQLA